MEPCRNADTFLRQNVRLNDDGSVLRRNDWEGSKRGRNFGSLDDFRKRVSELTGKTYASGVHWRAWTAPGEDDTFDPSAILRLYTVEQLRALIANRQSRRRTSCHRRPCSPPLSSKRPSIPASARRPAIAGS